MNSVTTTVFNGTSFVAKSLMARLGKRGSRLVIGHRGPDYDVSKFRVVGGLGQVYFARYDLKDEDTLADAMRYSDVVVNLVGKLQETKNFSFDELHVEGARRMARVARQVGVKKFIHFSSLNASPNPPSVLLKGGSRFLKSKYYGELAVREEFPEAVIIRPSNIFGERDNFFNHYTAQSRSLWTKKLAVWDYFFECQKQPVFINDVVDAVDRIIMDDSTQGKTYQAVGPHKYEMYDLVAFMRECSGRGKLNHEHMITNLRWNVVMRAAITIFSKIQKYPFCTWERVEVDCLPDQIDPDLPTIADLGVKLTEIELLWQILGHYRPRPVRYEVPYESAIQIDLPKRVASLQGYA